MAFISFLKAKKAGPGRHADGTVPGLCLVVQPSGSRSWVLRLQRLGHRRDLGLTLSNARFSVSAFAKNLTGASYVLQQISGNNYLSELSRFGVELKVKLGSEE